MDLTPWIIIAVILVSVDLTLGLWIARPLGRALDRIFARAIHLRREGRWGGGLPVMLLGALGGLCSAASILSIVDGWLPGTRHNPLCLALVLPPAAVLGAWLLWSNTAPRPNGAPAPESTASDEPPEH